MKENSFYFVKIGQLVIILGKHYLLLEFASKSLLILDWQIDIDSTSGLSILKLL